jgi:holo-[acyl-carrier protein] synthase
LAARFAAKEAFGKALGRGLLICISKRSLLKTMWGNPCLKVEGEQLQCSNVMEGGKLHLSITHEGDIALAFVVWEV